MAVSNGALFVWAAGNTTDNGNTTYNAPTIQAGMPAYISELHKGWIAAIGVKPDGTEYNPQSCKSRSSHVVVDFCKWKLRVGRLFSLMALRLQLQE